MVPLGDKALVEARFGPFGYSLIMMQDRCTVCVERTIGSEIILDTPDRTPRLSCRISLLSFGDSVSVGQDGCTVYAKRTIGSEIILDAPDRTTS